MRKIEHIEHQISELSPEELAELRDWILERGWLAWDAQIESDVHAGKLGNLLKDAETDLIAGQTREF